MNNSLTHSQLADILAGLCDDNGLHPTRRQLAIMAGELQDRLAAYGYTITTHAAACTPDHAYAHASPSTDCAPNTSTANCSDPTAPHPKPPE